MMGAVEFVAVKTDKGLFVSDKNGGHVSYKINGKSPVKSHCAGWFWVEGELQRVHREIPQPRINHRYVLVEDAPGKDELPQEMPREEVTVYDKEEYACVWKDEFKHLASLYELKSDEQEPLIEEIPFAVEVLLEVPSIDPVDFKYKIYRSQWTHEGSRVIRNDEIKGQLIDQLVFPPVVKPELPCKFTSRQVYNIVRHYIKENINLDVATITSDYDFCFTVKKKIAISNPYTLSCEVKKSNGKSYKKPRYRESYVKKREVEVFEMTYSPENYKGYTPVPEMVANSHAELKLKMDSYLSEVMKLINTPLTDCPHCNGMGVVGLTTEEV